MSQPLRRPQSWVLCQFLKCISKWLCCWIEHLCCEFKLIYSKMLQTYWLHNSSLIFFFMFTPFASLKIITNENKSTWRFSLLNGSISIGVSDYMKKSIFRNLRNYQPSVHSYVDMKKTWEGEHMGGGVARGNASYRHHGKWDVLSEPYRLYSCVTTGTVHVAGEGWGGQLVDSRVRWLCAGSLSGRWGDLWTSLSLLPASGFRRAHQEGKKHHPNFLDRCLHYVIFHDHNNQNYHLRQQQEDVSISLQILSHFHFYLHIYLKHKQTNKNIKYHYSDS